MTYKELIRKWQDFDNDNQLIPDDETCPTKEKFEIWECNVSKKHSITTTLLFHHATMAANFLDTY